MVSDLFVEAKIRSLNKQKRRARRAKLEQKRESNFSELMQKREAERSAALRQKQITELIQTIKAMELISADTTIQRNTLRNLFSSKS